MRFSAACLAASLALVCVSAGGARAQARHERVKVSPIKAKGKTVGATIRTQLRPEDGGYNKVQMVLGKVMAKSYTNDNFRDAATGRKPGYVLATGPSAKYAKNGDEMTFKITYGQGNSLKPGDKVDVTTIWSKEGGLNASAPHVWGMSRVGVPSEPVTLP